VIFSDSCCFLSGPNILLCILFWHPLCFSLRVKYHISHYTKQ
jgi:hypothetical protein